MNLRISNLPFDKNKILNSLKRPHKISAKKFFNSRQILKPQEIIIHPTTDARDGIKSTLIHILSKTDGTPFMKIGVEALIADAGKIKDYQTYIAVRHQIVQNFGLQFKSGNDTLFRTINASGILPGPLFNADKRQKVAIEDLSWDVYKIDGKSVLFAVALPPGQSINPQTGKQEHIFQIERKANDKGENCFTLTCCPNDRFDFNKEELSNRLNDRGVITPITFAEIFAKTADEPAQEEPVYVRRGSDSDGRDETKTFIHTSPANFLKQSWIMPLSSTRQIARQFPTGLIPINKLAKVDGATKAVIVPLDNKGKSGKIILTQSSLPMRDIIRQQKKEGIGSIYLPVFTKSQRAYFENINAIHTLENLMLRNLGKVIFAHQFGEEEITVLQTSGGIVSLAKDNIHQEQPVKYSKLHKFATPAAMSLSELVPQVLATTQSSQASIDNFMKLLPPVVIEKGQNGDLLLYSNSGGATLFELIFNVNPLGITNASHASDERINSCINLGKASRVLVSLLTPSQENPSFSFFEINKVDENRIKVTISSGLFRAFYKFQKIQNSPIYLIPPHLEDSHRKTMGIRSQAQEFFDTNTYSSITPAITGQTLYTDSQYLQAESNLVGNKVWMSGELLDADNLTKDQNLPNPSPDQSTQ